MGGRDMRGHEDLVQARLEGWPVGGVDIVVDGLPGFDRRGKAVWFYLAVDRGEAAALDLRGCYGLLVFVHAPSYELGWSIFDRVSEFDLLFFALCAPEVVVRFDGGRIEEWAV